jgi:chaperonin cofactor prefoldin
MFNNNNFQSPLLNNNLFSNPFSTTKSVDELSEAYKKLEMLRTQQEALNQQSQRPNRTVFTDIANEWEKISDDERYFIESSKEYIEANNSYQQEFNLFLLEYLGNDFLKSSHGVAAERVLSTIKEKKEVYRNKFATDILEIKEQNSKLEKNNAELIKNNNILQEELKKIQEKISGAHYE